MSILLIIGCGAYFMILLNLKQLVDGFMKSQIRLKILQSDARTFRALLPASSTEKPEYLANISPTQTFTIYRNNTNQSQNILHLLLSFKCKHCKQLYTDLYHSLELLNINCVNISFVEDPSMKATEASLMQQLSSSSDVDPQQNAQLIYTYFSHKLGQASRTINQVELAEKLTPASFVPLIFLNGQTFPSVFELEDLYLYLKYGGQW